MNRIAYNLIDQAGWLFGLSALIGLLASSGYVLLK